MVQVLRQAQVLTRGLRAVAQEIAKGCSQLEPGCPLCAYYGDDGFDRLTTSRLTACCAWCVKLGSDDCCGKVCPYL